LWRHMYDVWYDSVCNRVLGILFCWDTVDFYHKYGDMQVPPYGEAPPERGAFLKLAHERI